MSDIDVELVRRIGSGDRDALGELYDRYASQAMAVAVRVVRDRGRAEDLVHDAFVAIWQKAGSFDATRGSVRGWLLTIVRNRAIDTVRRDRPTSDVDEIDATGRLRTTPNPVWEEALRTLDATALRAALSELPPEQREAIELAYFDGNTYRRVAELTHVPPGTAAGRLRLALGRLRSALEPER